METICRTECFETYVTEYSKLIFSVCYKMVPDYFAAEDLAQDTFLLAYRSLERFDGANPKAWLVRIATNRCLDYLKSAARRSAPTDDEQLALFPSTESSVEEQVLSQDVEDRLLSICKSLSPPYRDVAVAYYCEGIPISQLAEDTGQNKKTLQTQIYRAKGMIRAKWKEAYGDDTV